MTTPISSKPVGLFPEFSLSNQNSFSNALENHISEVKRGFGDISKSVIFELGKRNADAASRLDPRSRALYNGVLSGLRYDYAARFVSNVEYSSRLLAVI